jgi:hypothetical protein
MKLHPIARAAVLAAGLAQLAPTVPAAEYTATAIVAILPGNPFQTRLYSLQRVVLTQQFFAGITAAQRVSEPERWLSLEWREPSDIVVRYVDKDAQKAGAIVKATVEALLREIARRRAASPAYGSGRVVTPAHPVAYSRQAAAEGVIRVDGMSWNEAARKEAQRQLADLPKRILDPLNLREAVTMAGLITRQSRPEDWTRVPAEVRSSISFSPINDSWVRVRMVTSDIRRVALLGLLLSNAEKREVALTDRIPEPDLDFVRPQIRRDWYIFNCCQVTVKE